MAELKVVEGTEATSVELNEAAYLMKMESDSFKAIQILVVSFKEVQALSRFLK